MLGHPSRPSDPVPPRPRPRHRDGSVGGPTGRRRRGRASRIAVRTAATVVGAVVVTPWLAGPASARTEACPRARHEAAVAVDPTSTLVTTTIPVGPGARGVAVGSPPCAVTTTDPAATTVTVDDPGPSTDTSVGQPGPGTTDDQGPATAVAQAPTSGDMVAEADPAAAEPVSLAAPAATPEDAAAEGELARTGAPVARLTGIAVGLLATGALMLTIRRRLAGRVW